MADENAIGVGIALPNLPLLPRVQGIRSSLHDVTLRGDKLVDRLGGALIDGTLVRKMSGASELKIEVNDHGAKLLNSSLLEDGYTLGLDGLGFTYVAYERSGLLEPLILTHEASVVNRLRQLHGPHKAYRDEMTRAEFAFARVMELKPPRPRFVCPELHKVQPIKSPREGRKAAEEAKQTRGKGIGEVKLTVKGERADSAQIAIGDRALRVAESEGADTRVMISLMLGLIVESGLGAYASNYLGLESFIPIDPHNLEASVRGYLLGYDKSSEGAIAYFKKHPDAKAYEITQAVQASSAGKASNGAANYGPWADEAAEWVTAYGGGADATEVLRYPFEEKEKENHWKCITRLGGQVNWRVFESAGWVYFIAEPTLFKSHTRLELSDSTPGLLNTSIKGDEGKSHEEVTVEANVAMWSAPPGTVASLTRHGPADGPYLVDRIESPLAKRDSVCQITLKRPTEPKKEPANPTRSASFGSGSSGSSPRTPADAPEEIDKMLAAMERYSGIPYASPGETHGATFNLDPKSGDCSGMMGLVLHAAGLLDAPTVSGSMASLYEPGRGKWFVLYANAAHVFCEIMTKDGWVEWEEGGVKGDSGFLAAGSHPKDGFAARHPKGL